ncbi:cobaltochelatase subunit CobN [Desulforudis sp. DRI-14]|uniref:cobaltochelatase subunit CobN n=1 Tax=Desulforudis sp. DRI-14 TaxID=3459793 RepID=UPI00404323B3
MNSFLLLSTIDNTRELREALAEIGAEYGEILSVKKIYFSDSERGAIDPVELEEAVKSARVILVDIRGQTEFTDQLRELITGSAATVVVLVGGSRDILSLTRMGSFSGADLPRREGRFDIEAYLKARKFAEIAKKLGSVLPVGKLRHMRNWVLACEYYAEGGKENLKNLFLFLLREYCGAKVEVRPPQKMPDWGIWWPPDRRFTDLKAFKSSVGWDESKPTVGIFFYGGMHFADCTPVVEALAKELRGEVNLIPVFSKVEYNLTALRSCFFDGGRPTVDLVVNLQYFRLHGGPYGGVPEPTYRLLSELGVPVLTGFRSYTTEIDEWQRDNRLNPLETTLGVMLPELDGCIEPVYVGGLASLGKDGLLGGEVKEVRALPEGIERLAGRVRKWLWLRRKPNAEKRLTIILYDYPPGEANLGNAGYLDALESLRVFLEKLVAAGYRVEIPAGDLGEVLLSSGVVNTPEWKVASSGIAVDAEVYRRWYHELPSDLRAQIERHWGEPPGTVMARNAQILIPGVVAGNVFIGVQPSRGVHENPEKAYHDKELPPHHQYLCFYWWLQKEFRADCIVHWGMHGTLEFTKGKDVPVSRRCFPDTLVGNVPHLYYYWVGNPSESTIAKRRSYAVTVSHASPPVIAAGLYGEYLELEELLAEYRKAEGRDKETLAEAVKEKAQALSMPTEDLAELEVYLYRMKRRLIPKGLHVLDRRLAGEDLIAYLTALIRFDREVPSFYRMVAERKGFSYESLAREPEAFVAVDREVHQAIGRWLAGDEKALPPEIGRYLAGVRENIARSQESAGLLSVLDGRYLLPNLAGDPVRSPEVYPVGRNMYEFDPRLIPTSLALKRGEEAVEAILERFYRTHGRYPETVGMVLWGFETLSTGGETVAQILAYLGVRLVRKESPWFKELELIPLDELGRPRIDVLVTICGIFRDICGPQIELINRAVELAACAAEQEKMNFIRKHSLEAEAEYGGVSRGRVFGPHATEYATSMRALVESGVWREEKELVESYDNSMCHCYHRGKVQENRALFTRLVSTVDVVSQVRHSTEYEFTDLDHYYEFFGGLSRSVAEKKGKAPEQWVVDTTEEITEMADVGLAIDRAVRTRLFNPRWIDEMLEHKYHGAQKIVERLEYLIGLKATTGRVSEWVFREALHRFLLDQDMRRRLAENNRFAALEIAKRIGEAMRRGYLSCGDEESTGFQNAVLELEAWIEEKT